MITLFLFQFWFWTSFKLFFPSTISAISAISTITLFKAFTSFPVLKLSIFSYEFRGSVFIFISGILLVIISVSLGSFIFKVLFSSKIIRWSLIVLLKSSRVLLKPSRVLLNTTWVLEWVEWIKHSHTHAHAHTVTCTKRITLQIGEISHFLPLL